MPIIKPEFILSEDQLLKRDYSERIDYMQKRLSDICDEGIQSYNNPAEVFMIEKLGVDIEHNHLDELDDHTKEEIKYLLDELDGVIGAIN